MKWYKVLPIQANCRSYDFTDLLKRHTVTNSAVFYLCHVYQF